MNVCLRHLRIKLITAAVVLLTAGSTIAAAPAWAAPAALSTARTVAGCGKPMTVHMPTSAAYTSAASLAGALNLRASDPLVGIALKHHLRWLDTVSCTAHPGVTHLPKSASGSAAAATSYFTNWSGYTANLTNPGEVYAEWVMPAVSHVGSTPDEEASSIWPGMGGLNGESGELIQDGTEQNAFNGAASQYFFWIELFPEENEQQITNLVPAVGDTVYVETDFVTPNANFHICDLTQNACVYGSQSSIPPGNSVEWIVERTSLNNSLYPLPNFGSVLLYDTYWYNSANNAAGTPADAGATPAEMCSLDCKTLLDSVGSLGSDGQTFPVTWLNAGP